MMGTADMTYAAATHSAAAATHLTSTTATGVFSLLWVVIALPLLSAAVLLLGGRRTDRWGHWLGVAVPTASFLISLAMFGHGAWFTNAMMLPADIAPHGLVASVYGIASLGGGVGGMIATETTGIVVDRLHSYLPIFMAIGIMPLAATAILATFGARMKPLTSGGQVSGKFDPIG